MSIWMEFGPMLERLLGRAVVSTRAAWRPGDQRVYVINVPWYLHQLPEKEHVRRARVESFLAES